MSDDLPAAPLERAAHDGRLVVFVGAGVSIAPPTCLPSWWEINGAVVDALARQVEREVGEEAARGFARTVIERQRADRFPPEYQAEVIVARVRHRYFEVLRCLDGDEPNASHLALAALARAGCVRAILTTNFDRVMEAAFRTAGAPLDVRYRPEHFDALAADPGLLERADAPCQLLKIHGSADAPDTLVDTLSQRKRGLPAATDACVRTLLHFGHWLFVGFSGADLAADPGYLHLRGDRDAARGFTWLVRTGEEPLDAVRDLAGSYGERAQFAHGELPAWLDGLARQLSGDDVPEPVALTPDEIRARRDAASRAVLEHTDAWAVEQGHRRCAVVLGALLDAVGDPAAAVHLLSSVRDAASPEDRKTGTYGLVCEELGSLHRARGEHAVALDRYEEAATVFDALDAEQPALGVRGNMALALTDLGRFDEALGHFEAVREGAARRGAAADEAVALHNIALVHGMRGDDAEAVRMYEAELATVIRLGDERGRAAVLLSIGEGLASLGRYDEALERLRESAAIVERLGDEHGHASALGNIARVHADRGEYDEATRIFADIQSTFERLGAVDRAANVRLNLAAIAQARGRLDDALERALDVADHMAEAGLEPMRARALHTAGAIHRDRGDAARGSACLEEALALRTAAGDRRGRAETLNEMGILRREQREFKAARDAHEEALRLHTELGAESLRAGSLHNLALLAQERGDLGEARDRLREALEIHHRLGAHLSAAPAAFNLGNIYLALREPDAAIPWFENAAAIYERIGNPVRATDARLAIAWTHGVKGRLADALNAFAAADGAAATREEHDLVAQRMYALADVYRDSGHADAAIELSVRARRIIKQGEVAG